MRWFENSELSAYQLDDNFPPVWNRAPQQMPEMRILLPKNFQDPQHSFPSPGDLSNGLDTLSFYYQHFYNSRLLKVVMDAEYFQIPKVCD